MMLKKKKDFIFASILYVLNLMLIPCTNSTFWETFFCIFEKQLGVFFLIL
jgi:hypothetical protein